MDLETAVKNAFLHVDLYPTRDRKRKECYVLCI